VAAAFAAGAAACSGPAPAASPSGPRIVRLVATNFGYEPARIEVHLGETIRFILENPTDLPHELVVGSTAEHEDHAAAHHAAGTSVVRLPAEGPASLSVRPHGTGQLEYRFDDPAATILGCHIAGHWESGMRAEIVLSP